LTPGEFKTFGHSELNKAIDWVGEQPVAGRTQVFADEGERED
jgi:hypothetical protein